MDELVGCIVVSVKDVPNVFDRGYVDYAEWDDYYTEGVRFVSRFKFNATIHA